MNRFERWTITVNILTLLAIIAAGVIYYRQLTAMQAATSAAEKGAGAAKDSANVARDALNEANRTFVSSERAQVTLGAQDGRLMRLIQLKAGSPLTIAIYLQNGGKVPATRVMVNASVQPLMNGARSGVSKFHHVETCDPRKDEALFRAEHPDWEESIIAPGSAQVRYVRAIGLDGHLAPLSKTDIHAIKQAGYDIGVIGTIEYCDGFGGIHCFQFCTGYKPPPIDDFIFCQAGYLDYCWGGFAPPSLRTPGAPPGR